MPKIKTNRSAAKRFNLTGTGKITRGKGWHSHLMRKKTHRRKRVLRQFSLVHKTDLKRVRRTIPNYLFALLSICWQAVWLLF